MTSVDQLHRDAMEAAEQADVARVQRDSDRHRELICRAFELERQAADLVAASDLEPTRSVLHRSAASLGLEAGEHREAERLIGVALAGTPPAEILDELRSLLQDVHFHQHLTADGIELEPNELEYTLIGCQVGEGIAPSAEFMRRIDLLDQLVFRTAERKAGRPFRAQGRRDTEIQQSVELFVKVPRAASFAIGFRLGHRGYLPGMDPAADVVADMIRCFGHFARSEAEPLKELIPDKDYFESFVRIAKKLAPDGRRVGTVGLAGRADGRPQAIVLKPESGREIGEAASADVSVEDAVERVTVTGTLLLADSEGKRFGKIDIVQESGERARFRVTPAMMADIVRPFFETQVVVAGHRKGNFLYLDEINPA